MIIGAECLVSGAEKFDVLLSFDKYDIEGQPDVIINFFKIIAKTSNMKFNNIHKCSIRKSFVKLYRSCLV